MIEIQAGTRIAVMADIHGNSLALDAALHSISSQGPADAYWFLGDYVAIGPDPIGIMNRLGRIQGATYIRGNTDRLVAEGVHPWSQGFGEITDPARLARRDRAGRSFAWTTGAIGASGHLGWFRSLPLQFEARFPDGTRVLAAHAAPGEDDGVGIHPGLSDAELGKLVRGVPADLVLVGHTHYPQDRRLSKVRVVNPGSISNPWPPDLGAKYVLIDVRPRSYALSFHSVEYDRERVVEAARSGNHPGWEYIASFMRGERMPPWAKETDPS